MFIALFKLAVNVIRGAFLLPRRIIYRRRLHASRVVDDKPSHVVDDKPSTTLTNLPTEILLGINSYLPPQSKICLGLTSKSCFAALSTEVDLKIAVPEEKALLLRLLERDLPDRMLCFYCNKLYLWKFFRGRVYDYNCPLRNHGIKPTYSLTTCTRIRHLYVMRREMVDAFLRGFELGPAYGPPLSELAHECGSQCYYSADHMSSRFEARVVQGKLILHAMYQKSFRVPPYDPATQGPNNAYDDIQKFNHLGCLHCGGAVPAVILHAIKYVDCYPSARERSELVSCVDCATDLRVRALYEGDELRITVNVWHCFGDRIQMDPMERAFFGKPNWTSSHALDQGMVPTRDLERLYEDGTGGIVSRETEGQRTWLQAWRWDPYRRIFFAGPSSLMAT
ncbi:hypothetical protein LTR92_008356 [Exophiala xenobiotica]|nr:hypothetical protein LTR92_008356 [Exophiala xenobiotica]KAK5552855.1 hypothetical protein LTR46_009271 [Exophiala xenobiotica]